MRSCETVEAAEAEVAVEAAAKAAAEAAAKVAVEAAAEAKVAAKVAVEAAVDWEPLTSLLRKVGKTLGECRRSRRRTVSGHSRVAMTCSLIERPCLRPGASCAATSRCEIDE